MIDDKNVFFILQFDVKKGVTPMGKYNNIPLW